MESFKIYISDSKYILLDSEHLGKKSCDKSILIFFELNLFFCI